MIFSFCDTAFTPHCFVIVHYKIPKVSRALSFEIGNFKCHKRSMGEGTALELARKKER